MGWDGVGWDRSPCPGDLGGLAVAQGLCQGPGCSQGKGSHSTVFPPVTPVLLSPCLGPRSSTWRWVVWSQVPVHVPRSSRAGGGGGCPLLRVPAGW